MFRVVVVVGIAMVPVILLAVVVDPIAGAILFGHRDRRRDRLPRSSALRSIEPRAAEVAPVPDDGVHRVLVVANETVGGPRAPRGAPEPPRGRGAAPRSSSSARRLRALRPSTGRRTSTATSRRPGSAWRPRSRRCAHAGLEASRPPRRPPRPQPGDRGRSQGVPGRRGRDLDPPARALALARVRRGRARRAPSCRSP